MTTKMRDKPSADHFERMRVRLSERLSEVDEAIAAAGAEVTEATLAEESAGNEPDAIKRRASAERRFEKLDAERRRLSATMNGIDARIAAAREQETRERRQAAARDYIACRDEQDRIAAHILEQFDVIAADVAKIRELAAAARRARKAAFGAVLADDAPDLMWVSHYAGDIISRNERRIADRAAEARQPWRRPRGRLAAVLAELDL